MTTTPLDPHLAAEIAERRAHVDHMSPERDGVRLNEIVAVIGCGPPPRELLMTFGSICSGIEAASVAWHPLGWRAAFLSEIEAFPRAVLTERHGAHDLRETGTGTPLWGDFTALRMRHLRRFGIAAPDVLVGGTPCQGFSVAGLRGSLGDERSNLALAFIRLANAIDNVRHHRGEPALIIVWENVPGVLSTKDNAFGCFLGGLAGADAALVPARGQRWTDAGVVAGPRRTAAWRTLDAQYFGLAQRRERVFVIASARAGFDPPAVLFEPEGVRRHSPPRREAGQDVTPILEAGARTGKSTSDPRAEIGIGEPGDPQFTLQAGKQHAVACPDIAASLTHGVDSQGKGGYAGRRREDDTNLVAEPITASYAKHGGAAAGKDSLPHNLIAFGIDSDCLDRSGEGTGSSAGERSGLGIQVELSSALRSKRPNAVAFGGNNTSGPIEVATAVNAHGGPHGRLDFESETFVCGTLQANGKAAGSATQQDAETGMLIAHSLRAEGFDASEDGTGRGTPLVTTLAIRGRGDTSALETREDGLANALLTPNGGRGGVDVGAIAEAMSVRRLLPVECEKLQGFPPGFTAITHRGKPAADGPRYRALGNSMAVSVMSWLGKRIAMALTVNPGGL